MPPLGRPDQKSFLPRTLNWPWTHGEVSVGYEYRGFTRAMFLQIVEKKNLRYTKLG